MSIIIRDCFQLVCLCFVTALVSSRGTIMNNVQRRFIPLLLYLRVPIFVFEIIWNIIGTVWIFGALLYLTTLMSCATIPEKHILRT